MPQLMSPEEVQAILDETGYSPEWIQDRINAPASTLVDNPGLLFVGGLGTKGLSWLGSKLPFVSNLGNRITGLGSKAVNNVKNLFRSSKTTPKPSSNPYIGNPEQLRSDLDRVAPLSGIRQKMRKDVPSQEVVEQAINNTQNPILQHPYFATGLGLSTAGALGVGINDVINSQPTSTVSTTTPTNYTPVSVQYNPNNNTLSATPIQTTTPITQNENIYVPPTQVTTSSKSKGRRTIAEDFNNPLNIASGKNVKGRGAYKQYNSLEEGFRDSWQQLQNLQDKNKIQTLGQLIDNWERSPKKKAQYLNFVMNNTGLKANDIINLKDVNQASNIIAAMSKFESPLGKRYNADTVKGILSNTVATPNPYFNAPWLEDKYINEYLN